MNMYENETYKKVIDSIINLGFKKIDGMNMYVKKDFINFKEVSINFGLPFGFYGSIDIVCKMYINDQQYGMRKTYSIKEIDYFSTRFNKTYEQVIVDEINRIKERMIFDLFKVNIKNNK